MRYLVLLVALTAGAVRAADLESRADAYLQPYLDTRNFQGVVLMAQGEEVLLEKGYGMASLELNVPNTPATVFHIASVSKPFTAAAVMALVEDDELSLESPLSLVVPEYPQGNRLTLHHLLAHTSGIPNINGFDEYADIQLKPQTPESLLQHFKDRPLGFEPGSRFQYSNSNFNLLALAVERASGLSFGEFLATRVLGPVGTQHAAHHGDATVVIEHRAEGYAPEGLFGVRRGPWLDWSAKTGNGSMVATARDLYLWCRAFSADRIVTPDSRRLMLTEHTENVGYGWFIRPRHDRKQYHINGRSPGFSSYMGYYPDDGVTIVVLSNLYNSITTDVGTDLAAMVFGLPYEIPSLQADPLSEQAAKGLEGRYRYGPDFYNPGVIVTMELRGGHVHQRWGDSGFESALIPQGDDAFIDRAFWSEVRLVRDEDGRVAEVWFEEFVAHRVE